MKTIKITGLFAVLVLLAACVTINIYFPAAQAEQAAERIVEDILGDQVPSDDKGALHTIPEYSRYAGRVLEFFLPSAQAAQPDFNADTPAIRKLQASMKSRTDRLAPYYTSGAVGFARNALLEIRDPSKISLKERAAVASLVADENSDRNRLYQAIADANNHPEWESKVRATFARTWAEKAAKGWWYQEQNGSWKQR